MSNEREWLLALVAQRAAELRAQRDAARHLYRADHPQLLELQRQAELAQRALDDLRAEPSRVAA